MKVCPKVLVVLSYYLRLYHIQSVISCVKSNLTHENETCVIHFCIKILETQLWKNW